MTMWILYLIQNTFSNEIYFGITSDLKQRLQNHNSGGSKFTTRNDGKWMLVYAEAYRSKCDALVREKRLKVHGNSKIQLIKRLKESMLD
jgi:putative endonuclease